MSKVYIIFDIEHIGNHPISDPEPFAYGFCTAVCIDGLYQIVNKQRFTTSIEYIPDPDRQSSYMWWINNHPDLFKTLTSDPMEPVDVAKGIVNYIKDTVKNYPTSCVVICSDTESDFTKTDCFLDKYNFHYMNYYTGGSSHYGETMNINSFFKGYDFLIDRLGVSVQKAKTITTVTQHTHDPLDDASALAERFITILNMLEVRYVNTKPATVFANGDEVALEMNEALEMCISDNTTTQVQGFSRLKNIRAYIVRMRQEGNNEALRITPSIGSFDQVVDEE